MYTAYRGPNYREVTQRRKIILGAPDSKEAQAFYQAISLTRLKVHSDHEKFLRKFYQTIKGQASNLADLYKDISYGQFLARLAFCRYPEVYLDGRELVFRAEDHSGSGASRKAIKNQALLRAIGTARDKSGLYEKYLTTAEFTVSSFVGTPFISPVCRDGYRPVFLDGKTTLVKHSFEGLTSHLIISTYPAGLDLRNGDAFRASPDFSGVSNTQAPIDKAFLSAYDAVKRDVYGAGDVKEAEKFSLSRWKHRTKRAIESQIHATIVAIKLAKESKELSHDKIGNTLIIKGLGLGAFGWKGITDQPAFEAAFKYATMQAIKEYFAKDPAAKSHISHIEIQNLPSLFKRKDLQAAHVEKTLYVKGELKSAGENMPSVVETFDLHPLADRRKRAVTSLPGRDKTSAEILQAVKKHIVIGVPACGDSASMQGNECNVGCRISSSDDPSHFTSLSYTDLYLKLAYCSKAYQQAMADIADGKREKITPEEIKRWLFAIPQVQAEMKMLQNAQAALQNAQAAYLDYNSSTNGYLFLYVISGGLTAYGALAANYTLLVKTGIISQGISAAIGAIPNGGILFATGLGAGICFGMVALSLALYAFERFCLIPTLKSHSYSNQVVKFTHVGSMLARLALVNVGVVAGIAIASAFSVSPVGAVIAIVVATTIAAYLAACFLTQLFPGGKKPVRNNAPGIFSAKCVGGADGPGAGQERSPESKRHSH